MARTASPLALRVRDVEFDRDPAFYAKHLASYISDASTIRTNTVRMFGRSPSLDIIKCMMREAEAARNFQRRDMERLEEWNDNGNAWRPRGLVSPEPPKPVFIEPESIAVAIAKPKSRPVPKTPREVIAAIAADYGFTADEITGKARHRKFMMARNAAAYALKKRGNSFPSVGKFLGGRDHSTIVHAVKRFEDMATGNDWAIVRQYYRETVA